MMNNVDWTDYKLRRLRAMYKTHSDVEIGEMLGCSKHAVRRRRRALGLNKKNRICRWREDEIKILITSLGMGKSPAETAALLPKRSRNAVLGKARTLGIRVLTPHHHKGRAWHTARTARN